MTNLKHIYSVDQNYASILELLYELHKDMDKVIAKAEARSDKKFNSASTLFLGIVLGTFLILEK